MRDKIKFSLFAGAILAIVAFIFIRTSSANANGQSRIIDRGESSYKGIRAVCDDKTGNLVYQADGIAGPIAVVPGGCAVPRFAQPTETTLSAPTPAPSGAK